jgi:hypothetical protein
MALGAAHRDAVFAFLRLTTDPAAASTVCIDHAAMNRAERWCRERREDERVRGNVSRDASSLVARKARCHQEVGVAAVALRAGRTTRLASVATGHEDEAWSLPSRRPPSQDCS